MTNFQLDMHYNKHCSTCHDVAAGTEELLSSGLQGNSMLCLALQRHMQAEVTSRHALCGQRREAVPRCSRAWEYPEVPSEQLNWICTWAALLVSVSSCCLSSQKSSIRSTKGHCEYAL